MGNASSTQRGGKATQSQTVLQESTNVNTPKDIAQAANIAKDNLTSLNLEQNPKKDDATPTEPAKVSDQAASIHSPPVSSVPVPEFSNAVSPSEPPPTLEVVASQHDKDTPTLTLAQGRKILERNNARNPTAGTRPEKRTRRGRGKRKDKVTAATQNDTENVPPATQQNTQPRRRRARGSGYDIGTRPAARRGRTTSSVGGVVTANVVDYVTSQTAASGSIIEEIKTTDQHGHVDRARGHDQSRFDAGMRPKNRARRRLPSQGDTFKRPGPGLDVEMPKAAKYGDVKTTSGLASEEIYRRSAATVSPACGETKLPESTTEGDVSTVHPLPSSTRRRAKEYFQRRTRERSVDAGGRPQRRCVTLGELEIRSSVQVPRSQPDLNSGETVDASANPPGKSGSPEANRDRFVFDPEASPFTPNATSSPRQASLSSIGVQSFSSPTPLPSHGNRKVAPLVLPETSNRSTWLETKRDSVPQMVPLTSHADTHGLAYTHAGANQTQAHLQAEQIALMRLQAYYNWLAGNVSTSVHIHGCEHMDMSGGGGGLSGGVALGRPAHVQGRGKGQSRNASGAYAHPKEHVVFSPRDHEQTEIDSQSPPQQQTGIDLSGKGESETSPEPGEVRRGKWDGKWGLREVAASGKEVGWNWGMGTSGTAERIRPNEWEISQPR